MSPELLIAVAALVISIVAPCIAWFGAFSSFRAATFQRLSHIEQDVKAMKTDREHFDKSIAGLGDKINEVRLEVARTFARPPEVKT